MITIEIKDILANIPTLMQYYAPGACAIALILISFSKKLNLITYNIYSCIWSYISISLVATIRDTLIIFDKLDDTPMINSLLAFVLSGLIGLIVSVLLRTKKVKTLVVSLFNETGNSFILEDIIDYQHGSNIKLTLYDKDYYVIGRFYAFDKTDDNGWIAVRGYSKYSLNHEIIQDFTNDITMKYVVRFKDVDTMEIY